MTSRRFSLLTIQIAGGSFAIVVVGLIAGLVYAGMLRREAERLLIDSLLVRGQVGMSLVYSRISATWETFNQLARRIDPTNLSGAKQYLTMVQQTESRWLWLGIADVEGRVSAGADANFEGESVSAMPWFRRGLLEPSGDETGAGILLDKRRSLDGETNRSTVLSAPLHDAASNVTGVLIGQVSWRWLTEQLASISAGQIDMILVTRDNTIVLGPAALLNKRLDPVIAAPTSSSAAVARIERWPDGKDYVTTTISSAAYRDIPDLGWKMILRQDLNSALAPTRSLIKRFWSVLLTAILASLGLLVSVSFWFTRPLKRLVQFARELAERPIAPSRCKETLYKEVDELASYLTRLQLSTLAANIRESKSPSDHTHIVRLIPTSDRSPT